jgi:hypothetical protein
MLESLIEAILAPIVEGLFTWLLFVPIGALYLFIRHRGSARRQQVLAQKYEGSYANAGQAAVLNGVIIMMIVLLVGMVAVLPMLHWLRG